MTNKIIIENIKALTNILPIENFKIFKHDLIVSVKPNVLLDILLFFKNHVLYQFKVLTCISGVDYPTNKHRFKIVYELLSIRYNFRIRLKTYSNELVIIDSCEKVFPAANWYECEIWDMFGVFF